MLAEEQEKIVLFKEHLKRHEITGYWGSLAKKWQDDYRIIEYLCDSARPDSIREIKGKHGVRARKANGTP